MITGGGGQLASDLELLLSDRADVTALSRAQLDITDRPAVESAFVQLRPQTVYNCAAFHNVDACEHECDAALQVNFHAVRHLAERCRDAGGRLVHLSTNYVFDGVRETPYGEHDLPAPRSVYAISKLAGEHAALGYADRSLVIRSAGLYGLRGSVSKGGNFVVRMAQRARVQGSLRMVADQRLSPTFTADLAEGIIDAVEADVDGVIHLTNDGACSWYEFTQAIMATAGIEAEIEPVKTEPGSGAERPLNGVLARPAAEAAGLPRLRHWREALSDYMSRAGLASDAAGARH